MLESKSRRFTRELVGLALLMGAIATIFGWKRVGYEGEYLFSAFRTDEYGEPIEATYSTEVKVAKKRFSWLPISDFVCIDEPQCYRCSQQNCTFCPGVAWIGPVDDPGNALRTLCKCKHNAKAP